MTGFKCWWKLVDVFVRVSLKARDYRAEFSQWWVKEMKSVKLPAHGSVFDFYLDPQTRRFTPWSDKVPSFQMEPDVPLQVRETVIVQGDVGGGGGGCLLPYLLQ